MESATVAIPFETMAEMTGRPRFERITVPGDFGIEAWRSR